MKVRKIVHGAEAGQRGSGGQSSESHLGNWSINDTLLAELVQQSFCDLCEGEEEDDGR